MFSNLVNSVFPFLGEFFGNVAALSNANFYETWNYFLSFLSFNSMNVDIVSTNLFNGSVTHLVSRTGVGAMIILKPVQLVFQGLEFIFIPDFVRTLPFWQGLLVLLISTFIIFAIIKFLVGIVTGS